MPIKEKVMWILLLLVFCFGAVGLLFGDPLKISQLIGSFPLPIGVGLVVLVTLIRLKFADRHSRRPTSLRAIVLGAAVIGLVGYAQVLRQSNRADQTGGLYVCAGLLAAVLLFILLLDVLRGRRDEERGAQAKPND